MGPNCRPGDLDIAATPLLSSGTRCGASTSSSHATETRPDRCRCGGDPGAPPGGARGRSEAAELPDRAAALLRAQRLAGGEDRGARREGARGATRGRLDPTAYTRGVGRWQVSFFSDDEVVQRPRRRPQRGHSRAVVRRPGGVEDGARLRGAFGRKLNAPYVWIPLCLLFVAPFFDLRPFRLLHLDLLVMLAFGVPTSSSTAARSARPRSSTRRCSTSWLACWSPGSAGASARVRPCPTCRWWRSPFCSCSSPPFGSASTWPTRT